MWDVRCGHTTMTGPQCKLSYSGCSLDRSYASGTGEIVLESFKMDDALQDLSRNPSWFIWGHRRVPQVLHWDRIGVV